MLENADLSQIPSTSLARSQNNKDFYPQKYEERTKLLQIYFAINLLNVSSHKDYINKARNRAFVLWEKRLFGSSHICRNWMVKRHLFLFWCSCSLSTLPLDELLSVLEHLNLHLLSWATSGLNFSDTSPSFTMRIFRIQPEMMWHKLEIHEISDKIF